MSKRRSVIDILKPKFICRHDNSLMRIKRLRDEWVFSCSSCLRWFNIPWFSYEPDEIIEGLARAKIVLERRKNV